MAVGRSLGTIVLAILGRPSPISTPTGHGFGLIAMACDQPKS
jgi:hypothetical protein